MLFHRSDTDPEHSRGVDLVEIGEKPQRNHFTLSFRQLGQRLVECDPDRCIAGTADVHTEVVAGQASVIAQAFKVTGAIAIVSPGATRPEPVTATPPLSWAAVASEDEYLVEVFDAFGRAIWSTTIAGTNGATSMVYAGPALASGGTYQLRVTASKRQGTGQQCALSRTEDLRGVFFLP